MRCCKIMPLVRGIRYNVICAMCIDGLCAVASYENSNNLETVMHFLQEHLLVRMGSGTGPMNAYPGLRSVLILDNASYHHGEQDLLTRFCEGRGVRVVFLPAYR
jgi:hypothetical protein